MRCQTSKRPIAMPVATGSIVCVTGDTTAGVLVALQNWRRSASTSSAGTVNCPPAKNMARYDDRRRSMKSNSFLLLFTLAPLQ